MISPLYVRKLPPKTSKQTKQNKQTNNDNNNNPQKNPKRYIHDLLDVLYKPVKV